MAESVLGGLGRERRPRRGRSGAEGARRGSGRWQTRYRSRHGVSAVGDRCSCGRGDTARCPTRGKQPCESHVSLLGWKSQRGKSPLLCFCGARPAWSTRLPFSPVPRRVPSLQNSRAGDSRAGRSGRRRSSQAAAVHFAKLGFLEVNT